MRFFLIFFLSTNLFACPELHFLFQLAITDGVDVAAKTVRGSLRTLNDQMDAIARLGYQSELTNLSRNKWMTKVKKEIADKKAKLNPNSGEWLELDIAERLAKEFPLEFEAFSRRFPATPHVYTDPKTGEIISDYPKLPNSNDIMTFETDVELSCCILEVTNYSGDVVDHKKKQLRRFLDPSNSEYNNINPRHKPVVLYAPGHRPGTYNSDLVQNPNLIIVRDKDELIQVLKDMRK